MASIGERNALRVVRESKSGLHLDGEELGEILLPGRYIIKGTVPGDYLEVFVHRDSEDRIVATTEIPKACVGDFAALKVVSLHPQAGAFLDWGLSKDLLLPIREQSERPRVGDTVVVYVYLDRRSNRIVATTRLDKHLGQTEPVYAEGQKVPILVARETPLGYKVVVDNAHQGLLYKSELGSTLEVGQSLKGYIRAVRPDGKLDLGLDPAGYVRIAPLTEQIMEALENAPGHRLPFGDQSTPDAIRMQFATSKKAFKQAIGALYRQKKILFTDYGIEKVAGGN
jgi:predicted RNA-binding protein (virulence factor B family)